jgi:outer membrane lipoprotein-sorting protein/lambda repressor-like predicted transcriptional regulator
VHLPHRLFLIVLMLSAGTTFAADIERGRTIYNQLCFNCHGPTLDGGIGPSLRDAFWQHGSSPEAILSVISKGIPNTEMIAYEAVYPEADRLALRDFILSEQEGMRETLRSVYPRSYFKGKRLTAELFKGVESDSQTALPENVFHAPRAFEGVYRGTAKLYIKEPGSFQFSVGPKGRTTVLLNGEEVHYSDDTKKKSTFVNKKIQLDKGVHDLEVLHEEKKTHGYRFHLQLQRVGGKQHIKLTGKSLEGSVPKVLRAGPEARVVRKWIAGLPPRTLLCLLPNKVIVAYNPVDNQVLSAWHSAEINQTPSLDGRSQRPTEVRGTPIESFKAELAQPEMLQFLHYETKGEAVWITSLMDGKERTMTIAPSGEQSFQIGEVK